MRKGKRGKKKTLLHRIGGGGRETKLLLLLYLSFPCRWGNKAFAKGEGKEG